MASFRVFSRRIHRQYLLRPRVQTVKAVYFDMCGTIVDPMSVAPVAAFRDTFQKYQISLSNSEIRQFMGAAKVDHVQKLLQLTNVSERWRTLNGRSPSEQDIAEVYQNYVRTQKKVIQKYCVPVSGLYRVLDYLSRHHIQMGTTSGFPIDICNMVFQNLRKHGIQQFCSKTVMGSDSVLYGARPSPFLIWHLMIRQNIQNPAQVIKVGDTFADIKEGLNAGTWNVSVTGTSSELGVTPEEYANWSRYQKEQAHETLRSRFAAQGADYVIPEIKYLPWVVDDINKHL